MKKLPICILALVLSGCFAQKYVAPTIDRPVMMSGAASIVKPFQVLKHFRVEDRSGWFILGLIPSGRTDVDKIVNDQVKASGGDACLNLSIETEYDPVDFIVAIIVGGIYNTRLSIIEGDVIKYN